MKDGAAPETLLEAIKYFADADNALVFMVAMRWPNGISCPHCATPDPGFLQSRRIWKCRNPKCRKQFSIKVGTIFEDSPIGLDKWLPCLWMVVNCKNGISSYEVARDLGVTQKTAWFMLHRIRLAMQTETFAKLDGEVEVDETFIGGKARNMHRAKRLRIGFKGQHPGKVAVMGLLERHGREGSNVRAAVINTGMKKASLQGMVRDRVEPGATVNTDKMQSYVGLDEIYTHKVVDHAERYVDGQIHTNGLENFWSLLKRGLKGTYVSVEPFHLFRYLDEQVLRYNLRKGDDASRFVAVARNVTGRRLTYKALTGIPEGETC